MGRILPAAADIMDQIAFGRNAHPLIVKDRKYPLQIPGIHQSRMNLIRVPDKQLIL